MVNKYSRHLEQRDINVNTGNVWSINDVPRTWRTKTEQKVFEDRYYFDEDGTAYPVPPNDEEDEPSEETVEE